MNKKYQPSKKLTKADGTIAWVWEGKLHNWEEAALVHPDGKKGLNKSNVDLDNDEHLFAFKKTIGHKD